MFDLSKIFLFEWRPFQMAILVRSKIEAAFLFRFESETISLFVDNCCRIGLRICMRGMIAESTLIPLRHSDLTDWLLIRWVRPRYRQSCVPSIVNGALNEPLARPAHRFAMSDGWMCGDRNP
jgi:hypothetical protein